MYRASIGDLQQARPLLGGKVAVKHNFPGNMVEFAARLLTVLAILCMALCVLEVHSGSFERPLLAICVEPQSHGRASAQGAQQQLVGRRSRIVATRRDGLVGEQFVCAKTHRLLKLSSTGLTNDRLPLPWRRLIATFR